MNSININLKINEGTLLPLMEAFYTIQGEGFYKGSAAYFIRLGGCDVGCHCCERDIHPPTDIVNIVNEAKIHSKIVVVTGGEPLMWNMFPLTKLLNVNNIKTHIETSGAYELTGDWDWICLSPKKNKNPLNEIYKKANELKVIVYNLNDLQFAVKQSEKVNNDCILYLQPEWSKRDEMMPIIVDYVMKNTKWKVSLQTHKYLNIP